MMKRKSDFKGKKSKGGVGLLPSLLVVVVSALLTLSSGSAGLCNYVSLGECSCLDDEPSDETIK